MRLLKEQEQLCRELGNKHALAISLGNQAIILESRGDFDTAIQLLKEQEQLFQELGNKDAVSTLCSHQALLHLKKAKSRLAAIKAKFNKLR